jgi:hypothetical protein
MEMPVSKPCVSAHLLKVSEQIAGIERTANRGCKYKSRFDPPRSQRCPSRLLLFPMFLEDVKHWTWQIDHSPASLGLRVSGYETLSLSLQLSANSEDALLCVEVSPLKTKRFPSTKARHQHESEERFETVTLQVF